MSDAISIGQDPDGTPSIDIMVLKDLSISISVTKTGLAWAWANGAHHGHGVTKDDELCHHLRVILGRANKEMA